MTYHIKTIEALQVATKAVYEISDSEEAAASIFTSLALTVLTEKHGQQTALEWLRDHVSQNPYLDNEQNAKH